MKGNKNCKNQFKILRRKYRKEGGWGKYIKFKNKG